MAKIKGLGSTLSVSDVAIAQIVSISGPGSDVGTVETTDLSSTFRTYLPTVSNSGEIGMEIHYSPQQATHTTLEGLVATPAVEDWDLDFADGSNYAFDGILTGFEVSGMEVDGVVMASITIQITGAITITAGSL